MTGFRTEIDEQPEALRRTAAALESADLRAWAARLADGSLERVIFSGMGASSFAGIPAQLALIERGIEAFTIDASVLLYDQLPLVTPDTLLVLSSQSGESVEVVKLLDALNDRAPILAITNTPGSTLARRAAATLVFQAGSELTVSSKTYTCTLAALHLLADVLAGDSPDAALRQIEAAADALEAGLPGWHAAAGEIVARLDGCQSIVYLGRGGSFASAQAGALVTKESAKFPTEAMHAAQYRHGPLEMTDERIGVFIFAGDARTRALNLKLAGDLAGYGARVTILGSPAEQVPDTAVVRLDAPHERLLPLVEIVPIQCFAAAFAAHRGFTPGQFRYIQKVTTQE